MREVFVVHDAENDVLACFRQVGKASKGLEELVGKKLKERPVLRPLISFVTIKGDELLAIENEAWSEPIMNEGVFVIEEGEVIASARRCIVK